MSSIIPIIRKSTHPVSQPLMHRMALAAALLILPLLFDSCSTPYYSSAKRIPIDGTNKKIVIYYDDSISELTELDAETAANLNAPERIAHIKSNHILRNTIAQELKKQGWQCLFLTGKDNSNRDDLAKYTLSCYYTPTNFDSLFHTTDWKNKSCEAYIVKNELSHLTAFSQGLATHERFFVALFGPDRPGRLTVLSAKGTCDTPTFARLFAKDLAALTKQPSSPTPSKP